MRPAGPIRYAARHTFTIYAAVGDWVDVSGNYQPNSTFHRAFHPLGKDVVVETDPTCALLLFITNVEVAT